MIDFESCFERAGGALASLLRAEPPEVAVPSCPGWTLGDLAGHLVAVFQFARTAVTEGRESDVVVPAIDPLDIVPAFDRARHELAEVLAGSDEAQPCWTMGPPAVVGFWKRRIAQETTLHLWDAESAVARAPSAMPPALAADGINEVVEMFYPRQVRLGRIMPLHDRIRLEPTDAPGLFLPEVGRAEDPDRVNATVTGTAQDLLLTLWRRRTPTPPDIRTTGDSAALARVLSVAVTP